MMSLADLKWPSRRVLTPWLIAALAFLVIAGLAATSDRFPGDLWLARRIQEIDTPLFTRAIDWAEDLGDAPETTTVLGREITCSSLVSDFGGCLLLSFITPNVVVAFLGAVSVLLLLRRPWETVLLLSTGVALVANAVLERIVGRPSPDPDLIAVLQEPGGTTFPSGHTAGVVVLYGLLFYFAGRFIRPPLLRLPVQAACVYVAAFTAVERLYVGVHWPSDILGGALHGALWLAPIIWLHRRRFAPPAPAVASREV